MLQPVNIRIILRLIALISLLSLIYQYVKTRRYIERLPALTRRKYLGLQSFSEKLITICIIILIVMLLFSNTIGVVFMFSLIMFIAFYTMSELGVLKEYANDKRRSR